MLPHSNSVQNLSRLTLKTTELQGAGGKHRGTEKIELSSETNNFQILENETLVIANYKYAKIFKFAKLDIKL